MILLGPGSTPRVTTGNVRTTYDLFTPSPLAATPGATPNPFNGLACPLGTTILDQGGPDSVSGTTTQLPVGTGGVGGQVAVYKYVLYKSTTNPAVVAAPGCVYYTDETGLVVSGSPADGFIAATTAGSASDIAGVMMLNSTDLTTLTATLLNNGGNGSGIWVCIGGFVKAMWCLTAGVAGDYVYGTTKTVGTAWVSGRVAAAGAAVAQRQLGNALTSAAALGGGFTQDVQLTMGSIATY
jgi:hypothetical protein